MERTLAKGQVWELTHDTYSNSLILHLHSEYGTVEVKSKGLIVLGLFESIEREYLRLSDLGPIENEVSK